MRYRRLLYYYYYCYYYNPSFKPGTYLNYICVFDTISVIVLQHVDEDKWTGL